MTSDHASGLWPRDSVCRGRQVDLARALFRLMNISQGDQEKRKAWQERVFRFFDAPVAVIVMADRVLSEFGPLFDIGMAVKNLCLAAVARGWGFASKTRESTTLYRYNKNPNIIKLTM